MTHSDQSYSGMTQLGPGVYDDHRGGLHVDLRELLEANGYEPTDANKLRLQAAIARGGAAAGIPVMEWPR